MVGCFNYNNIPLLGWNKTKLQGLPAEYYYMGRRRRLENTMFFSGLPSCMELCGDGKQQNVFSNRITHFGGAASCLMFTVRFYFSMIIYYFPFGLFDPFQQKKYVLFLELTNTPKHREI